ncbi:MAG: glycosyltransferase family 4 protein [Acidobacteria bacterium]|nr:glycosyltransferase family 4 protein [Acidobacteriota bacterium]
MNTLRMLALSPVPEEGAGCRFRIAQYVPALATAGIDVTISPFFTREFFELVYRKGQYFRKASLFARRALDRLHSLSLRRRYDIIYIYREAFPVGPAVIETLLAQTPGVAMLYDFDDAVYLPNTSDANRAIAVLKWPRKVKSIVSRSDGVIAGNEYLAAWARQYSDAVRVIPTCVDTTKFVPRSDVGRVRPPSDVGRVLSDPASRSAVGRVLLDPALPVVGWIGTPTTVPYLLSLQSIFQDVARAHPFVLRVCGAGADVTIPGVKVDNVRWTLDAEVSLFNTCDVGVYPLSDDEWARGKCGFKAIQFMACGVPVVAAPVGVNREIIQDGASGLLASTPAEWIEKLGRLLSNAPLRADLGAAGRRTIEAGYSLTANAPKMVTAIHDAVERARHRASARAPVPTL